jgi:hypothetical protein
MIKENPLNEAKFIITKNSKSLA